MRIKKLLAVLTYVLFFAVTVFAEIPSGYMSLNEIARKTESTLYWDSMSGSGTFEKNGHHISFSTNSPILLFNYTKISLISMPINYAGTIYANPDFLKSVQFFFENLPPEVSFRVGAIIIDPGHGGKDPGTVGQHIIDGKKIYLEDKSIALFVAKDLHARLSKIYPDKQILLIRDDDTYLTLAERTDIANTVTLKEDEAIIYVSIHANAALNKDAKGFEVWYLSPDTRRTVITDDIADDIADDEVVSILNSMMEEEFTTESILMAKYILDGLDAQVGNVSPNRGLKENDFFVVKNANMPSILVELGFVTNEEEALRLSDENYLHKTSLGIYNGLTAFVTHFEQSRGFTSGR